MMQSERSGSRRVPSPSQSEVIICPTATEVLLQHSAVHTLSTPAAASQASWRRPICRRVIPVRGLPTAIGQIMTDRTAEAGDIGRAKDLPHTLAILSAWAEAKPPKPTMASPKGRDTDERDPTRDRLLARIILQLQPGLVLVREIQGVSTPRGKFRLGEPGPLNDALGRGVASLGTFPQQQPPIEQGAFLGCQLPLMQAPACGSPSAASATSGWG
jgi:hypothetical protein